MRSNESTVRPGERLRALALAGIGALGCGGMGAVASAPDRNAATGVTLSAAEAAPIERYLHAEMSAQGIPGLAVAVIRRGRVVYARGFGVATLEHDVPVRPDTRFQIGSIGKQFTAVLIEQLAREGRLALDEPLSKYLPEIPPGWAGVSLRLMLNHQSGIAQLTAPEHALLDLRHEYTEGEYIRLAASLPLDFAPGTDTAYSDTAYVLLGFVIARVTGRFYGDLLQERIFGPLGMARTRILSDTDIIPGRASGYQAGPDGALRNQAYVAPFLNRTADGSLYSTVLDLARWDAALAGERVLPQAVLARMWRIDPLRDGRMPLLHYGYGWEINTLRGHRVVEYDGNWQGFQAALARFVDLDLSVVVLTNRALCRAQRIAHAVAGVVDAAVAPYPAQLEDAQPQQTRRLGELLEAARAGRELAGFFAPQAWSRYGAGWARSLGRDLREDGTLRRLVLVAEPAPDERIYRADLEDMTDYLQVRQHPGQGIEAVDLVHEY